jgi:hypothetical protein
VADELDYAATIPASALASAAGKFSKQYGLVNYYESIAEGKNISYEDYAYLGITEDILQSDLELAQTKEGKELIKQKAQSYKAISSAIETSYNNGIRDVDQIITDILENNKSDIESLGLNEKAVEDIVKEQYSSMRNLEVRMRLLGKTGDNITVDIDGQTIDFAKMSKFSEGDKGTSAINYEDNAGTQDGAIIRTVEAEDAQKGYRKNMIENIRTVLRNVMSGNMQNSQTDTATNNSTQEMNQDQFDKAMESLIDKVYEEYGDIFSSKLEVKEFLATGMDALSLYTARDGGVGTGSYMVETDENGKAQNIYITNNGLPMKSLNMPGMWAIELMEGCESINKPSLETFISSKEALAAFEWSVGFSGTFSSSIRTLLKDLNYAEVGGSMPDTMKVGVTTALTQTQSEIAKVIADARKKLNAEKIAGVDLIMTANFDGTTQIVQGLKDNGVDEDQIVSLSLDLLDSELTKLSDTSKYEFANVEKVMEEAGVEDYSVDMLSDIDMNVKIKVLQEVLKNVMKAGEVSFIVGDVSLLGRGWNPGDMGGATSKLKSTQGHQSTDEQGEVKVQATMWKVNFEKMDATQSEQGDGRFAHRDGKSRFSSDFFNRDIVQITSVESVRENKILREAAAENNGYSVDLILNNLNDVMEANEESTLQKANNTVVNVTKQWAQDQQEQGKNAITYEQAINNLSQLLGNEAAAENVMNKILETARVRVSDNSQTMTRDAWFEYENYVDYVAACKAFGVQYIADTSDDNMQQILKGDTVTVLKLINNQYPSENMKELIARVETINDKYSEQEGKITSLYQSLSQEDKERYNELQKGAKFTLKDIFKFRELSKAQKELNSYIKDFDEANDAVFSELTNKVGIENLKYFGLQFNDKTKNVTFNRVEEENLEEFGKIVALSEQQGNEKLAAVLDNMTVKAINNVISSKNPYGQILKETDYLGYGKQINKEVSKQVKKQDGNEELFNLLNVDGQSEEQKDQIRNMIAFKVKQEVLASIGTDEQNVNIPASDAKVIRTILDMGEALQKESKQSANETSAKPQEEGIDYNAKVNEIVEFAFKAVKSKKYSDAKEMLGYIINGITAPSELNEALPYVLDIWSKDTTKMLEYIGLQESDLGNKELIIQNATRSITKAIELSKEGELSAGELKVEIALVTTLRDLLITAGQQENGSAWLKNSSNDEIMSKLVVSKAVNQNVIVNMFEKGVKESVSNATNKEFVIDVKKLQSAVVDKTIKFAKDANIDSVMDILKDAKTDRFRTPLMRLSDIHAVAASA